MAHGFQAEEVETVMIGPAAELAVEVAIPAGVTIRRVEVGPELLADVERASAMQERVFGGGAGRDAQRVADEIAADPDHLQLWVAESGGEVVAAGTLDVVRGTEFAGFWGGSVRGGLARPGHLPRARLCSSPRSHGEGRRVTCTATAPRCPARSSSAAA